MHQIFGNPLEKTAHTQRNHFELQVMTQALGLMFSYIVQTKKNVFKFHLYQVLAAKYQQIIASLEIISFEFDNFRCKCICFKYYICIYLETHQMSTYIPKKLEVKEQIHFLSKLNETISRFIHCIVVEEITTKVHFYMSCQLSLTIKSTTSNVIHNAE